MKTIKATADHIDQKNIAGQELEMVPVLLCAELDRDGTMKSSPGAVVKAELFEVAQTTADPVLVVADIAVWLGIPAHNLRRYVIRISVHPLGGVMSFSDELRIHVGPVATGMKLQIPDVGVDPTFYVFPCGASYNEIHADSHSWASAETHNYLLYVEAIYQPRGV